MSPGDRGDLHPVATAVTWTLVAWYGRRIAMDLRSGHGDTGGEHERCPNCQAVVSGPFCSRCGQRQTDLDRPFRELVGEILGALWAFDERIVRTLWPLVARPGFLTEEFLAGRRARYVHPFKLFFVLSVLLFLGLSLKGEMLLEINVNEGQFDQATQESAPSGEHGLPETGNSGDERSLVVQHLIRAGRMAAEDPEGVNRLFVNRLAKAVILLVPLFAAVLALLYRKRRYVVHLVFSMHLHSFAFIALLAGMIVDWVVQTPDDGTPGGIGAILALAVYTFFALRRVFSQGRLVTVSKMVLLGIGYLTVMVGTVFVTMVATLAVF